MKNNVILSVKDLSKEYYDMNGITNAVDNFSLDLRNREFISIVGPSGCGKSTILSILSNCDEKTCGKIDISSDKKIGYMLQTDSLFPWRNILDNCLIGLEISKKLDDCSREHVINLLKKYGLEDFIYKYPSSLSGGMKQRVALIRTLALKPDILLLDEPLSALDSQTRLSIGEDILRIIKNEGKSAIMVTHDIGEAIALSDRIVVLTKRPAKIKNIYEMDFDSKLSSIDRRNTQQFIDYQKLIWSDLDE